MYIKNCLAKITPHFTMKRQLDDYYDRFYQKEAERSKMLQADNFAKAKELAAWKEKVAAAWDSVEVKNVFIPQGIQAGTASVSDHCKFTVVIDGKNIADSLGLDLVFTSNSDGQEHNNYTKEMKVVKREGSLVTFEVEYTVKYSGIYKYSFRLFPISPLMAHRMDFAYTRWF
jgi:starch phosphorylase